MTPEQGKIATLLKGAQRPRSLLLGQVDVFYTCELLYYWRPNQDLYITRECLALETRPALRRHWRAAACASYLSDLAARIAPRGAPMSGLYRWLEMALDCLAHAQPPLPLVYWFELKLLTLLGMAPQLTVCVICAQPPGRAAAIFTPERSGIVCHACAGMAGITHSTGTSIGPDSLGLLRFWQGTRSWRAARRAAWSSRQRAEIERLLGLFLERHLDVRPDARQAALATLNLKL